MMMTQNRIGGGVRLEVNLLRCEIESVDGLGSWVNSLRYPSLQSSRDGSEDNRNEDDKGSRGIDVGREESGD